MSDITIKVHFINLGEYGDIASGAKGTKNKDSKKKEKRNAMPLMRTRMVVTTQTFLL